MPAFNASALQTKIVYVSFVESATSTMPKKIMPLPAKSNRFPPIRVRRRFQMAHSNIIIDKFHATAPALANAPLRMLAQHNAAKQASHSNQTVFIGIRKPGAYCPHSGRFVTCVDAHWNPSTTIQRTLYSREMRAHIFMRSVFGAATTSAAFMSHNAHTTLKRTRNCGHWTAAKSATHTTLYASSAADGCRGSRYELVSCRRVSLCAVRLHLVCARVCV